MPMADLTRFSGYGLPVVPDSIAGWPGPLAGILACLDWLAETHPACDLMLSCATDAPFIPSDLAERLLAARTAQGAVLAQAHHLAGVILCSGSGLWRSDLICAPPCWKTASAR